MVEPLFIASTAELVVAGSDVDIAGAGSDHRA
jgi:hypothetical protein